MTSSDAPEPEGGTPPPSGSPAAEPSADAPASPESGARDGGAADTATLIAAGHLHPGMLFLRLVDGLRQAVIPVVLGLVSDQLWLLVVAGVFFVFALVYALARYLTFEYRLTTDELVTTEGILHRQERRIPVNRIQDLSFESTLIRRVFGLVVVSVETASSQGSEARLDSLSRSDAENLREALYYTRKDAGVGEVDEEPPTEQLIWQSSGGELFLLGITNNRIGVILAAVFGVYELAAELGFGDRVGGVVSTWLSNLSGAIAVVVAVGVLVLALLGGWVVSIAASFLMFHDFKLTVREEVFQRRYGLITTRAASLPRRKIQRVLLEQSLLRRLLRVAVVRADSAGSGMDPREEVRGGRDVVMPLAAAGHAEALVPLLLPGVETDELVWSRVSSRVILRIFLKGVVFTALALAIGLPAFGLIALAAVLLLPISYAVGVLSYHNLAYAELDAHFGLRWGILGRYRALLPLAKVQGVVVRASPIDRMLDLGSLTVYVAGGSPSTLRHVPITEAHALQDRLVRIAAASRFVW